MTLTNNSVENSLLDSVRNPVYKSVLNTRSTRTTYNK